MHHLLFSLSQLWFKFVSCSFYFVCSLQILADAMGLGKTVMTIALILANPGRGISHDKDIEMSNDNHQSTGISNTTTSTVVEGGTLIVCPMALLGQWKVISYVSEFLHLNHCSKTI